MRRIAFAERLERLGQIGMLLIEVLLALRRRLVLFDGREVDRPQPLNSIADPREFFDPCGLVGVRRQRLAHRLERQPGRFQLFERGCRV